MAGFTMQSANETHEAALTRTDKLALAITRRVGSVGFFMIVFTWTTLWCGYNLVASQVPSLRLNAFDPFPAFVAYLLISNVVQILLMPLIMVGQTVDARHAEIRADKDHEAVTHIAGELDAIREELARITRLPEPPRPSA